MASTQSAVVRLPERLVAEIETVKANADLERFVQQAVESYVITLRQQSLKEKLARNYEQLAADYDELATELADEAWLPAENEALLTARAIDVQTMSLS